VGTSIVIRDGRVFDPATSQFSRQDIAITDGRIARIAPAIEAGAADRVIDAAGLIVTPGLVDIHVHAFRWGQLIGLDVDPLSSRSGVTTFVDGGSSGSLNFMAFRRFVVERVRSNLYALLNVSAIGQTVDGIQGVDVGEYDDLRFLHLASAVEVVEKNHDLIVGIKVRMYTGLTTLAPMASARELADAVGLPLTVHVAKAPRRSAIFSPICGPVTWSLTSTIRGRELWWTARAGCDPNTWRRVGAACSSTQEPPGSTPASRSCARRWTRDSFRTPSRPI
jgi:dihydroorotase